MDPNAIMSDWINAPARESITSFNEWIIRGGFSPTVQIAAHTDLFMRGERYGTVIKLGTKYAWIKGNHSKRVFRVTRDSIARVIGQYS